MPLFSFFETMSYPFKEFRVAPKVAPGFDPLSILLYSEIPIADRLPPDFAFPAIGDGGFLR